MDKAKTEALTTAGFKLSRGKGWAKGDVRLSDRDLEKLPLHELDQVLEGARQGVREVSLGNRMFQIRK